MQERRDISDLSGLTDAAWILASCAAGFVVGAAVGVGVAEWLRARGLAWTWALGGLPVAVAAFGVVLVAGFKPAATGGAVGFSVGAFTASVGWGLKRRLEDRRADADRAD